MSETRPTCLCCKGPCPENPQDAFRVEWMRMLVGYLCSERFARSYLGPDGRKRWRRRRNKAQMRLEYA